MTRARRAIALVMLASTIAGCAAAPAPTPQAAAPQAAEPTRSLRRQTVAVLPFSDSGAGAEPRLAFLQEWLPDTIAADLQGAGELRVVERRELLKILEEQKLGSSALASNESRITLGKMAGAQTLVVGSFAAIGETLALNARLIDTESGAILKSAAANGATADARALGAELSRKLAAGLGLSMERAARTAGVTDDRGMAQAELYYRGVREEREGKRDAAIETFRSALQLDPNDREAKEHLKKLLGASH